MLPQISYTSANFPNASAASPCSPLTSPSIFINFFFAVNFFFNLLFLNFPALLKLYILRQFYVLVLIREPRSVSPRSAALGI